MRTNEPHVQNMTFKKKFLDRWNPDTGFDLDQRGNSDQERSKTLRRFTCFNCGKDGHKESHCYATKGENPPNFG